MFQLLNRISWMLSLTLWFIWVFFIWILLDEMQWNYAWMLDDDMIIFWIIATYTLWAIIKKVFLSKKHLINRLEFFAQAVEKRWEKKYKNTFSQEKNIISQNKNTHWEETEKITSSYLQHSQEDVIQLACDKISQDSHDIKNNISEKSTHEEKINPENTLTQETNNVFEKIEETKQKSQFEIYMSKFFSENLLAKIGSILVFLWVVFLMSLIWNQIPSIVKILIWFFIWFSTYIAWVILDQKWYTGESKILLWTWILINFLVILAGKYLISGSLNIAENSSAGLLSSTATFILLILNTIFAVATSLVYKSRNILLFGFAFAYLNPFLTWASSDTPYLLVGYSLIISLWAIFIWEKQNDTVLKYCAFIGGNILFLLAPFSENIEWISKIAASGILALTSFYYFYKSDCKHIQNIFIGNYIFIFALLFFGNLENILNISSSFIMYLISVLGFFIWGIFLFLRKKLPNIFPIFLIPLWIFLSQIFTWVDSFITIWFAIFVTTYLISFFILEKYIPNKIKYIFWSVLGIFIIIINAYSFNINIIQSTQTFFTTAIISILFLWAWYYLALKKDLGYLYSIGTFWSILMLFPILTNKVSQNWENILMIWSIITIIIFGLLNILFPFMSKKFRENENNLQNIVIATILWVLFIAFQLYSFWNIYFPGIAIWFTFLAFAGIYFILSYVMTLKLWIQNIKDSADFKNIVMNYLFISISLLTLSIALIFSNNPEIISTAWIFEASILFYFFTKTKENKIFILGMILFIIGTILLGDVSVQTADYLFFIPFALVLWAYIFNIKNLDYLETSQWKVIHDIVHIAWMAILWVLLIQIIPSTGQWYSFIWISIFLIILALLYAKLSSHILKLIIIFSIWMLSLYHIVSFESIVSLIDTQNLEYLRVLQYGTFAIISAAVFGFTRLNTIKNYNPFLYTIYILYTLMIVSLFIYDIFEITFAVTIFWWIVASLFLLFGISKNKIKLRTLWLYLLSLVLWKIFIYDIWYWLDDAISRVFALIFIGILMIIISTQYSRKYGNNIAWEFDIKNLYNTKK